MNENLSMTYNRIRVSTKALLKNKDISFLSFFPSVKKYKLMNLDTFIISCPFLNHLSFFPSNHRINTDSLDFLILVVSDRRN